MDTNTIAAPPAVGVSRPGEGLLIGPGSGPAVGATLPVEFKTPLQRQDAQDAATLAERPMPAVALALSGEVMRRFQLAWQAKQQIIDRELLADLRQREGKYAPDVLAKIQAMGGSDIYDGLTEQIAGTFESTLSDVLLFHANSEDDRPWGCDPTPIPELPPDAVAKVAQHVYQFTLRALELTEQVPDQESILDLIAEIEPIMLAELKKEAADRAAGMERAIADIFDEGDYEGAMYAFLTDLATYKNAFIMGPIVKQVEDLVWETPTSPSGIKLPPQPVMKRKLKLCFERLSPFDCFPDGPSINPNDGGFRVLRMSSRRELEMLRGTPGVIEKELSAALEDFDNSAGGGKKHPMPSDTERAMLEFGYDFTRIYQGRHETFIWWEWFTGKELNNFYIGAQEPGKATFEPERSYPVRGVQVGSHTVLLTLNYDLRGRVPVYTTSVRKVPGAFWGKSLGELFRFLLEGGINPLMRASLTAAAQAARARLTVDTDRLDPAQNVLEVNNPGAVIQTCKNKDYSLPPVAYFQPENVAPELMRMRNEMERRVYDLTGLQPFNLGNGEQAGAGQTLGGFNLLVGMQSKIVKKGIYNVDVDVTRLMVQAVWLHIMLYGEDPKIKGDVEIVARGAVAQCVRDEHSQKQSQMLTVVGGNPVYTQVVGMRGVAGMLRSAFKAAGLSTEYLPSDDDMRKREEEAEAAQGVATADSGKQQAENSRSGQPASPPAASPGQGQPAAQSQPDSPYGRNPTPDELARAMLAAAKVKKLEADQRLADARAAALTAHALVERAMATAKLDWQRQNGGGKLLV